LLALSTIASWIITRYGGAFGGKRGRVAGADRLRPGADEYRRQLHLAVLHADRARIVAGRDRFSDIFRVLWKEIRVAVMVGVVLALFNFLRMVLVSGIGPYVSLVVSLSMIVTVTISKSLGCLLPMFAKRLKMDPAVVASLALTTVVDAAP
jgi:magnesium transporter